MVADGTIMALVVTPKDDGILSHDFYFRGPLADTLAYDFCVSNVCYGPSTLGCSGEFGGRSVTSGDGQNNGSLWELSY